MERVCFIEHEGTSILYLDFSYCGTKDTMAVIREATGIIQSQPKKSLLTLTKTDEATFDSEVIKAMKEFTKGNEPYVRAGAIIGLKGLQKIVLNAVSLFSKREFGTFDDVEKAKEYLVGKSVIES